MRQNENQDQAQPGNPVDPLRAYDFRVEFGGQDDIQAYFTSCSGLEGEVEVIPFREAGANSIIHQLPGQTTYGEVELSSGLTQSQKLWDWFMSAVNGKVVRKNISIVMMGTDRSTEKMRWNLQDAWPRRWRAAPLDTLAQEVAIESLTLVFESIERVKAESAAAAE